MAKLTRDSKAVLELKGGHKIEIEASRDDDDNQRFVLSVFQRQGDQVTMVRLEPDEEAMDDLVEVLKELRPRRM